MTPSSAFTKGMICVVPQTNMKFSDEYAPSLGDTAMSLFVSFSTSERAEIATGTAA